VSRMFAGFRVDSTNPLPFSCARGALDEAEGGESMLSFTDLSNYVRARIGGEQGQTMAEYGVVLAVITIAVILALGLLSGAIAAALNAVTSVLS
jgi:Flp pilus assembly pilin Flp